MPSGTIRPTSLETIRCKVTITKVTPRHRQDDAARRHPDGIDTPSPLNIGPSWYPLQRPLHPGPFIGNDVGRPIGLDSRDRRFATLNDERFDPPGGSPVSAVPPIGWAAIVDPTIDHRRPSSIGLVS